MDYNKVFEGQPIEKFIVLQVKATHSVWVNNQPSRR